MNRKTTIILMVILGITQLVLAELPSPVPNTGQTASYRTGDDGNLKPGVTWPNPRFTVMTNGTAMTVLDKLTGLEWVKAPHSVSGNVGSTNWSSAVDFCNNLVYAAHSDWRMPSIKELESLVNCGAYNSALPVGHPFSGVQPGSYWSGTSYAYDTVSAWIVDIGYGYVFYEYKTVNLYVWPVRGGL